MKFHAAGENLVAAITQVAFESRVDWIREVERTTYEEFAIAIEV